MCDYSLEALKSRPAKVGDKLVTTTFAGTTTRGLCAVDDKGTAVCLLPGTELAFERPVSYHKMMKGAPETIRHTTARFRQIDLDNALAHHDAFEFPGGEVVLVTNLVEGQSADVLQLPAASRPFKGDKPATEEPHVVPSATTQEGALMRAP